MINLTESIENRWGRNDTIWSCLPFSLRNGLKNSDLVKRAGIIVLLGLAYGCFAERTGIIVLLGLAYGCFADITGISVPCPVRYLTGVLCPGCGITTLFLSVAHGDLQSAKQANAFIFYTLPLLIVLCYYGVIASHSRVSFLVNRFLMPLYLVALLAFGIYRNI